MTKITVKLTPEEARALMQMCGRLIYEQAVRPLRRDRRDKRAEPDHMMAAIYKLARALMESGLDPQ